MNKKLKDILVRSLKTFVQAFIATLVVMLPNADFTDLTTLKTTLISIVIGALASGISAVMNIIINYLKKYQKS